MKSKLIFLFSCVSYIFAQSGDRNNTFLRSPIMTNTTDTATLAPGHHHPIQTIHCVVKGEWFQKCVNAKETVKWNERYKRTDHCFRFGICQVKGNKCEWRQTKEMTNCLEDMKKSANKVIIE